MIKINGGAILVMMGFLGMMLGLTPQSLSLWEKIPIFVICFLIMILGALMQTPIFQHLNNLKEAKLEDNFGEGFYQN